MAKEQRLIDANARIEEIRQAHCTNCESYGGVKCRACWVDDAIGLIDDAPTVDAVEVVHGRWRRFINGDGEYKYLCGVCEKVVTYEMGGANYCPNCGAKMDGGDEDE